ncbi:ATP-binding protein [Pyrococcus sp. ST04]|uniref:AAA family ATPase n=1 Tax=Pyrococcus sp. ST04 TaxID=1183377 RepID=UPI0002605A8E|nr:ATP-binding protein [Pyrococcus sp. ST04]AFK22079.1 putative archaeal ATPase 1 [Pyrococcus sp. ST04]
MLFDPRPKNSRKDLFDREEELEELKKAVRRYPIVLLLGIRRVGKSSLLKVALNELENGIYIDVRELYFSSGGWITVDSLTNALERALNSLKPSFRRKITEALRSVKGVTVAGVTLKFESRVSLPDVLNALNDVGVIMAFDEAQYLRYYGARGGKEFLAMVAYAYDNLENMRFVFSGSEVGSLHDFLGTANYDSPLYGRVYGEITVKPFSRELSREFFRRGFEEAGMKVEEKLIERTVELLDGIPGWLVEFGYNYIETRDFDRAMESVILKAEKFMEGELRELARRSERYILILKAIAMGFDRWELIKDYLEARSGKIPNPRLANLLRNLEKMSWIRKVYRDGTKRYEIVDPVVARILRKFSRQAGL